MNTQKMRYAWTLLAALLLFSLLTQAGCDLADRSQETRVEQVSRTLPSSSAVQSSRLATATVGIPPTLTLTQAPDTLDASVLSQAQKDRLYRASLDYLADTEAEAVRVARGMQFVENEGHPANFCGPLSIAILRDAGLVDRYTDLHSFWLLNPRDDYTEAYILEKTFPREKYFWYRTNTPINEFNFVEFPLYSGDFIYLYAGGRGTFEHMMTVSRVDREGRVYAITAETSNGSYLISELMLYDPQNPGFGYFYDITNKEYSQTLGTTGFGGFQLWRPITPIPDPSPEEAAFRNRMDRIFEDYGGEWHVMVKEMDGTVLFALEANESIHPASVVKVPLAMLFLESLHEREIDDLRLFLVERGIDGRTYQQLLYGMLVDSEEEAAASLLDYTDDYLNPVAKLQEWGFQYTTITPRRTTASEITRLFEDLWSGRIISAEESKIILEQLAVYTSGDETRLGVIRGRMPEGGHFFSKRGSLVNGGIIVGEVAILELGSKVYVVSIFGYPGDGDDPPTYDELEQAIEDAAWVIWGYIQ
ncbi:MAG: serine hydrolase [Anaerolineales bacterium]|nr:serine hydrolase [Anaerolineales bacterium]